MNAVHTFRKLEKLGVELRECGSRPHFNEKVLGCSPQSLEFQVYDWRRVVDGIQQKLEYFNDRAQSRPSKSVRVLGCQTDFD